MTEFSSSVLTIDLGAVAHNYNVLKNKVAPGCRVAGVIKADAYGLGMEKILAVLENQNCPFYFVATVEEGLQLRALTGKPVGVFNGIFADAADEAIRRNLIPVLNSLQAVTEWKGLAARHDIRLPVILHFDTGMNRLGLGAEEAAALLAEPDRLDGLNIQLIMSHFACADDEGDATTEQQYERFRTITARFPGVPASLANSAGVFRSKDYHLGMARPGMALYGLNPVPEAANPMKPVAALEARILQVRRARRGESVGYGASHRLEQDTRLATVALGYADGFPRSLGGKGKLYYKGKPCPIVGRVSMDLTVIDMGEQAPEPGDMVEILGPHQSADDLADAAGTIGYEVLTSLGKRYRRVYKT